MRRAADAARTACGGEAPRAGDVVGRVLSWRQAGTQPPSSFMCVRVSVTVATTRWALVSIHNNNQNYYWYTREPEMQMAIATDGSIFYYFIIYTQKLLYCNRISAGQ